MTKDKNQKAENGISLERLIATAEDMNKIMGLDPEIDLEQDADSLIEEIKSNAKEIRSDDSFEEGTEKILKDLGFIFAKKENTEEEAEEKEKIEKEKKGKETAAGKVKSNFPRVRTAKKLLETDLEDLEEEPIRKKRKYRKHKKNQVSQGQETIKVPVPKKRAAKSAELDVILNIIKEHKRHQKIALKIRNLAERILKVCE